VSPVAEDASGVVEPADDAGPAAPLDAVEDGTEQGVPRAAAAPAPVAEPVSPAVEAPAQPEVTAPSPGAGAGAGAGQASSDGDALSTDALRRRWPEVLQTLSSSRVTWSLVSANAQVGELTSDTLYLAFQTPALARTFSTSRHTGAVQEAVYQTLGFQVRVEARLDEGGGPAPSVPAPAAPPAPRHDDPSVAGPSAPADVSAHEISGGSGASGSGGNGSAGAPSPASDPVSTVAAPTTASGPGVPHHTGEAALQHEQRSSVAVQERPAPVTAPPVPAPEAPVVEPPVVNAADEAWLAGASMTEPPADFDEGPEPPPVDVRRAAPSGIRQTLRAPAAPSAPTPAPAGPPPGVRESRRQTLERQAAEQKARQSSARVTTSIEDDSPSDDDPDLASSGLVGAPLVAQLLGGVVIDETIDTGL